MDCVFMTIDDPANFETRQFFKLFLGVDIGNNDANEILLMKRKNPERRLNVGAVK